MVVAAIAGINAEIQQLYPSKPGHSPHDFAMRPSDPEKNQAMQTTGCLGLANRKRVFWKSRLKMLVRNSRLLKWLALEVWSLINFAGRKLMTNEGEYRS